MYGIQEKTAPGPELYIDDTALEGLKIICRDPCDDTFELPADGDFDNHS